MTKPRSAARIHLLPAKASAYVLVIRRKPSKLFHIIRWNTKTDKLEHGSWFRGKLYPKRCDISFDGKWMVYLAMGSSSETWNGVSALPYLRTSLDGPNMGTWYGGGYWRDRRTLLLNGWEPTRGSVPFKQRPMEAEFGGEDLSVLYAKWARDGWKRLGNNYGNDRRIKRASKYTVVCDGDDGWIHQPTRKHPSLTVRYIGYLQHGYTFRFRLEGFPELIDDVVDSACWDSLGNLLFSRDGVIYKFSLHALKSGAAPSAHDLEPLSPETRST